MAISDDDAPWRDPAHPPVEAIDCGGGVWVSWGTRFDETGHPSVWHWCSQQNWRDRPFYAGPRWMVAGTRGHTLVAHDPIHLEPSLLWSDCCGLHGFLRGGRWTAV